MKEKRMLMVTVKNGKEDLSRIHNILSEYSGQIKSNGELMEESNNNSRMMMLEIRCDNETMISIENKIGDINGTSLKRLNFGI